MALDTLLSAKLVEGICLNRDWYKVKVSEIWCEPDITDIDRLVEIYWHAKEIRKNLESPITYTML